MKGICVFCSSSKYVDKIYYDAAHELAKVLVEYDYDLIWGGADIGIMGEIAKSVQKEGGYVRGVLPKSLLELGLEYKKADELIITRDMSIRKNTMNDMSDGYICLPGGFGTMEEILEVITLKQLTYLNKPIVFYNVDNFYDKFLEFVDHMVETRFVKESMKELYYVTDKAIEAIKYIKNYKATKIEAKW